MIKLLLRTLLTYLMIASTPLFALPSDRQQPIRIEADNALIDENTGITLYRGNVQVFQGTLLIEAAELKLIQRNRQLVQMIAVGNPAHFQQQVSKQGTLSNAYGNKLDYQIKKQQLTISGNAKVINDQDTFSGERIVYDLKRSIVDAYGGKKPGDKGRIQMIIQPDTGSDN